MQMPIRSLQSMLRLLQRHAGKPTTVVPDGIFGPETARAVREFQQQNGLPVTGAADLTTWNAVVDAAREAHIHHGPAEPLRPLFQPMQTISPGEQNMHLYLAQGMLQALRHYYDGMPPVSVTGRHDEACTASLKWLQARCGLPVTGELDRRTWQHMVRLYAQTVGDGTLALSRPDHPPGGCADAAARLKRSAAKQNFFAGKVQRAFPANGHGSPQPDRAAQS